MMSSRDRLNDIQQQPSTSVNPMALRSQEDQAYQELKVSSIHSRLLERIDLAAVENMPEITIDRDKFAGFLYGKTGKEGLPCS